MGVPVRRSSFDPAFSAFSTFAAPLRRDASALEVGKCGIG
jgi:hypothetical protein